MKTNVKIIVTPEQSKKIQEICFKNNITWNGLKAFDHLREPFLYIHKITLGYDCKSAKPFFDSCPNKEIDADLFIRTNGTCEEISDEGLSKIKAAFQGKPIEYLQEKVINLHKQINKDRIIIKNQKEELHKLNIKLQKCISLEEHHLKMKTVLNEKHKLEVESNELSNFFDLCLGYPRDKRMPLSSYSEDLFRNSKKKEAILYECNLKQQEEIEKLKAVIEYLWSKAK